MLNAKEAQEVLPRSQLLLLALTGQVPSHKDPFSLTQPPSRTGPSPVDEAVALIRRLAGEKFFGSLTIKFESGKVVILQKAETIKPNNYRDNRGHLEPEISI
jgi:hypothetical protein